MRLLRLVAGLALLCSQIRAIDVNSLKPQGYLSDFANVVDAGSREAINRYCAAVQSATGAQVSLVTLRSLEGEPLEDFSIDLFRHFGVGQKNKDNGVQLLLVIDDRQSRLEVGNGLEPILPDGLDGQILLDMRPELRAGHYGQAMLVAAERIGQTIAQAEGKQISVPALALPQHSARDSQHDTGFPWGLIVFGVVLLFLFARRGGRGGWRGGGGGGFWPGFLIGNILGGNWGSRGGWGQGGGFGGYNDGGSSSGGFGGFGGGDAGGGGASSSW